MTISDLGDIGELVGGVAVVISLVYVALQIRGNTRAVRASSHQAALDGFRELNRILNERPALAQIYRKGLNQPSALSKEERFQFDTFMVAQVFHFWNVFNLHESGVLDRATFESFRSFLLMLLQTPGGVSHWQETQPFHIPALSQHLNRQLARRDGLPPPVGAAVSSFGLD